MNPHRGLLHHLAITVSSVPRSAPFYAAVLGYLGYELAGRRHGAEHEFEDWKRWDLETPHEISIVSVNPRCREVPYVKGAVGHHHHVAFCAEDRGDVDRFHTEVLLPLATRGLCVVETPPCECPEYGAGYYATFFKDPDGLKYEFVINPNFHAAKRERRTL